MFNTLSSFFYHKTKLWLIGLIAGIFLLFIFSSGPIIETVYPDGEKMVSLDDPKIYSPEEIVSIIESWGQRGRTYQFWFHITWDLAVPVLYFFFLGFLIAWFAKRGFKPESKLQKLNLIALAALLDLLENISICALILAYPNTPWTLTILKTGLTIAKYSFGIVIIAGLVISIIFAARNRFKVQKA